MPDLPLLIGPDANRQTVQLNHLLEAVPGIKPVLAGATWVGGRRWNFEFQSGETLSLPEGDDAARTAYTKFDRMDQAARLLGQGFVHFDMRIPGKFVVRVSKEPGHEVTDPSTVPPPAPAGTDAI